MVTIGIPTFNRFKILKAMAESLYQSDISVPHHIRVYDDCSTEYGIEELKMLFPTASSIKVNDVNIKADENIFLMYEDFLSTGDSWFFNADSDLVFSRDWLKEALRLAESTSGILTIFNANLHHSYKNFDDDLCLKRTIGSAGTLFRRERVEQLIGYIKMSKNSKSLDWQFSGYFNKLNVPIFCVKKSLVQHIGYTGQNSRFFFDYGKNFAVETPAQGQIINDILENYIDEIEKLESRRINDAAYHFKRFWVILFKKFLPSKLYHSLRQKIKNR